MGTDDGQGLAELSLDEGGGAQHEVGEGALDLGLFVCVCVCVCVCVRVSDHKSKYTRRRASRRLLLARKWP